MSWPRTLLLAIPLTSLGCSEVATHRIGITGTSATQTGIPAAQSDGWTVTFDAVHVVVHHPGLIERQNDDPAWVRRLGVTVCDVVEVEDELGSHTVYEAGLRASTYDGFEFHIAPPSKNSAYPAEAANVDGDAVDRMVDDDASIRIVGSATDGTITKTFDWSFSTDSYYRCDVELAFEADGEGESVIEIAAEQVLRNNLEGSPGIAFAAIAAADADGDGAVTLAELDAAPLPDAGYEPGDRDIDDLGGWVAYLTRDFATVLGAAQCELIEPDVEG